MCVRQTHSATKVLRNPTMTQWVGKGYPQEFWFDLWTSAIRRRRLINIYVQPRSSHKHSKTQLSMRTRGRAIHSQRKTRQYQPQKQYLTDIDEHFRGHSNSLRQPAQRLALSTVQQESLRRDIVFGITAITSVRLHRGYSSLWLRMP